MIPCSARVRAIADAASRWRDADFPPRVRATRALEARTGYTEPVVDYALDALFGSIDAASLHATIAGELGSLDALAGFVARVGRPDVTYRPLARATIISSDTTIGVAIPALAFAICAGVRTVVKDRDDRLAAAFVASVVEERPELATEIATAVWTGGGDESANDEYLADADVVLAYGGDASLAKIRARLKPGARFVAYGHRTSVGYVARETLANERDVLAAAAGAARDALLYDGEGCLSQHVLFVESGGALDVAAFARAVASACDAAAVEFPAGFTEPDAAVLAYARAMRFRASQGQGAVHAGILAPHLVVVDPPRSEPPPFLRRTLAIYGVAGPDEASAFLARHRLPLEGIAFGGDVLRADLADFAHSCGASRIARLGDLQRPPLAGEHGGVGRILPFVRAIYRA